MDDSIGTILYIVLLLIIVLAGGLSKKKKRPDIPSSQPSEKKGSGSAVLDALLKGAGIPTEGFQPEPEVRTEEVISKEMPEEERIEVEILEEEEEEIDPFLSGMEGVSAFSSIEESPIEDEIKNHYSMEESNSYLYELLKDFTGRKAIIYGEIMNSKYF